MKKRYRMTIWQKLQDESWSKIESHELDSHEATLLQEVAVNMNLRRGPWCNRAWEIVTGRLVTVEPL